MHGRTHLGQHLLFEFLLLDSLLLDTGDGLLPGGRAFVLAGAAVIKKNIFIFYFFK